MITLRKLRECNNENLQDLMNQMIFYANIKHDSLLAYYLNEAKTIEELENTLDILKSRKINVRYLAPIAKRLVSQKK
jgi:hypothetical protein